MITNAQLLKILRKACKEAGSQRKWALDNKFSPAYVNDILHGKRDISGKVADKLGYEWNPDLKPWILKGKKKPSKVRQVKYD